MLSLAIRAPFAALLCAALLSLVVFSAPAAAAAPHCDESAGAAQDAEAEEGRSVECVPHASCNNPLAHAHGHMIPVVESGGTTDVEPGEQPGAEDSGDDDTSHHSPRNIDQPPRFRR